MFQPDVVKDLSEEVQNQKVEIEALTDFVNTLREEKKQVTIELTSTKMDLSWKEQEIVSLKSQIEIVSVIQDILFQCFFNIAFCTKCQVENFNKHLEKNKLLFFFC